MRKTQLFCLAFIIKDIAIVRVGNVKHIPKKTLPALMEFKTFLTQNQDSFFPRPL